MCKRGRTEIDGGLSVLVRSRGGDAVASPVSEKKTKESYNWVNGELKCSEHGVCQLL